MNRNPHSSTNISNTSKCSDIEPPVSSIVTHATQGEDVQLPWLAELEQRSRRDQQTFIDHISSRLGRPAASEPPAHPFRGAPTLWNEWSWNERERVERFTIHFQEVGGYVVAVDSLEAAGEWIVRYAQELKAREIVRQQQPELEQLRLEQQLPDVHIAAWNENEQLDWRAIAAGADIGIVMAEGAAAYTGTVMVTSSAVQGRAVSLLPTVCIVLLPRERLYTRLGELLIPLDQRGREQLPAGIHFISGPSRSSDIENDLTIGVHGPGIIYTLLIG
ncbi:LutC/YkgG family protein [Paenibacillus campi]|uniref:LutC/YkgG family protein n=1 Tax=Paenibacillus campi TaxID=3106031 RepID=UPI002AFF2FC2|nr:MULTISPECIES: LUD domain-containing protein [unclassified Paenibacillus]